MCETLSVYVELIIMKANSSDLGYVGFSKVSIIAESMLSNDVIMGEEMEQSASSVGHSCVGHTGLKNMNV